MNINQLLEVLIALSPVLVPAALSLVGYILSKLPQAQQAMIHTFAMDVVRAVEQLGAGKSNTEKKAMAVQLLYNLLKHYGINANPQLLDTLIESCVNQLPPTNRAG